MQELVQSGEFQSGDARAKVDELIERSRKSREAFVTQVRREVSRQLDGMGITNVEDLAKQVASLLAEPPKPAGRPRPTRRRRPRRPRPRRPGQEGRAKKAAAKKAPAKKAAGQEGRRPRRRRPRRPRPRRRRRRRRPAKKSPLRPPAPGRRTDPPPRRRLDRALVERGLAGSPAPGRRPDRAGAGAGVRFGRRQAGPPGGGRRAHRAARPTARGSSSRGGEKLRRRPGPVRHRSDRPAGARCRGLDRRVHRLPPPGRRRRRSSPSTWATASSTSGSGRTPG